MRTHADSAPRLALASWMSRAASPSDGDPDAHVPTSTSWRRTAGGILWTHRPGATIHTERIRSTSAGAPVIGRLPSWHRTVPDNLDKAVNQAPVAGSAGGFSTFATSLLLGICCYGQVISGIT